MDESKLKKGRTRWSHGSAHHAAKLTEADAARVIKLLSEGFSMRSIAEAFGVSAPAIASIRDGKTWKHVPRPAPGG